MIWIVEMNSYCLPSIIYFCKDRASCLTWLRKDTVNYQVLLNLDYFSRPSEQPLSVYWLRVTIHTHQALILTIVVFDLTIFRSVDRSVKFHKCQTDTNQLSMSFSFNIVLIHSELPDFDWRFIFVKSRRVEVEILKETFILFAVNIVSCSHNQITINKKSCSVKVDSSWWVWIFEETYWGIGMCEDIDRTLLRATYFFMKKVTFWSLFDLVVV